MWENKNSYNGLSVFPYSGKKHIQAPQESFSAQKYASLAKNLKKIDLTKIKEEDDDTDLSGEIACAGGMCSLT